MRPMSVAFSAVLESSSSERDLMVKEVLVSEAAYVTSLEKLIAVRRPHPPARICALMLSQCSDKMLADAKAKESPLDYDVCRAIFGNVKNIKMLNGKLAANIKTRLANWGPLALFADIFQVRSLGGHTPITRCASDRVSLSSSSCRSCCRSSKSTRRTRWATWRG